MSKNLKTTISLGSKINELDVLSKQLTKFFSQTTHVNLINPINLLLEELFSNTIKYGQCVDAAVNIELELTSDTLKIIYMDNGIAFNPLTFIIEPISNESIEDRKIGGLGIQLIKTMTNQLDYQRIDNQNILIMIKNIS